MFLLDFDKSPLSKNQKKPTQSYELQIIVNLLDFGSITDMGDISLKNQAVSELKEKTN